MKNKNIILASITAIALTVPALADPVAPNIAPNTESADCTQPVLGTTTGTSNLQAAWTPNTLNIDWYNGETKLTSNTCTYDSGITVPATNPTKTGYTFAGWMVKQIANILASLNIAIDGDHYYGHGWYNNADFCGSDTDSGNAYCSSQNMSGIARNEWKTEFSYGTVYGEVSCNSTNNPAAVYINQNLDNVLSGNMSGEAVINGLAQVATQEETMAVATALQNYQAGTMTYDEAAEVVEASIYRTDAQYNKNSTGQYCWCKATQYQPLNGSKQSVGSSRWVFVLDYESSAVCAQNCTLDCGGNVRTNAGFRGAMFKSGQ